ncbi:MAG: transglycosylase domain-containing protein [Burkholderiales bacterium]|nr:transglycosylase domain-containing protein [Burkholderiales bacterium]MDE2565007.1 transglycosylase domain-containing protein [Burkholderiales bacterium]
MTRRGARGSTLRRLGALVLLCALALQAVFVLRIASMRWVDPQSTPFQRSEAWQMWRHESRLHWAQQWVPMSRIAPALGRAVIASEDAEFVSHDGVEWDAIEKAWQKNQQAEHRAELRAQRLPPGRAPPAPKIVGGSTISQQLAKNLFLSGERTVLRKAQELVLTFALEALLSKERILEIYLNNVEWGDGIFGAQAAAQHYFHVDASRLGPAQAARLAVMLPAPKRFEQRPDSAYVSGRAAVILARMGAVQVPPRGP